MGPSPARIRTLNNEVRDSEREVCMCFHVHLSKLVKYHRFKQPSVASRFSECYGAGTGCGWCVPFLEQIFEKLEVGDEPVIGMSHEEYSRRRQAYHNHRAEQTTGPVELRTEADLDDVIAQIPDDMKLETDQGSAPS